MYPSPIQRHPQQQNLNSPSTNSEATAKPLPKVPPFSESSPFKRVRATSHSTSDSEIASTRNLFQRIVEDVAPSTNSQEEIEKLKDSSLSKRDFMRIIQESNPLSIKERINSDELKAIFNRWSNEFRYAQYAVKPFIEIIRTYELPIKEIFDYEDKLYLLASSHKQNLERLLEGRELKGSLEEKNALLILASKRGSLDLVDRTLKEEVDVNATDENGRTALHFAAIMSRTLIIERLLKVDNIELNLQDYLYRTPIFCALQHNNNVEVLKTLLKAQADVTIGDGAQRTPLHIAAANDNIESLKLLLEAKADIKAKDKEGWIPSKYARENRSSKTAKLLLELENAETVLG